MRVNLYQYLRQHQPAAIAELVKGVDAHERDQVLLGVTGSGKTFTMAQVIARTNRPALILAPHLGVPRFLPAAELRAALERLERTHS